MISISNPLKNGRVDVLLTLKKMKKKNIEKKNIFFQQPPRVCVQYCRRVLANGPLRDVVCAAVAATFAFTAPSAGPPWGWSPYKRVVATWTLSFVPKPRIGARRMGITRFTIIMSHLLLIVAVPALLATVFAAHVQVRDSFIIYFAFFRTFCFF